MRIENKNKNQTEGKAKVVAAGWGTELIQFHACRTSHLAPGGFDEKDELMNRYHPYHKKWMFFQKRFFKSSLQLNGYSVAFKFIPPTSSGDGICLPFCLLLILYDLGTCLLVRCWGGRRRPWVRGCRRWWRRRRRWAGTVERRTGRRGRETQGSTRPHTSPPPAPE